MGGRTCRGACCARYFHTSAQTLRLVRVVDERREVARGRVPEPGLKVADSIDHSVSAGAARHRYETTACSSKCFSQFQNTQRDLNICSVSLIFFQVEGDRRGAFMLDRPTDRFDPPFEFASDRRNACKRIPGAIPDLLHELLLMQVRQAYCCCRPMLYVPMRLSWL